MISGPIAFEYHRRVRDADRLPREATATFIGYIVAGTSGAALSTLAIFLPSFVFVAIVYPIVPRLRASAWMSAFLDGVNVAAIGLMLASPGSSGEAR